MDGYIQKKMKRPPPYTRPTPLDQLHTRINWKWIKDLNVRPDTTKILEENVGSKILDIVHGIFLWTIKIYLPRETKEKINKWDYIKLKSLCTAKEIINKIKRQPTEWENTFCNISEKELISKTYLKNLQSSTSKEQTSQLKNGQKTWIGTSSGRTYRWPVDIWKDA